MIDEMEFTTDWVTARDAWWREAFAALVGNPARMLEVGCYEGRSAQWWLSNVLTHPRSELICVDRWPSKSEANRARLLADPEHGRKFSFHAADAIPWAARLLANGAGECFDAIYSDFSKEGADIMSLACLAFRLLKPGGLYLFDDYAWRWQERGDGFPAPQRRPDVGIDAWLAAHEPFCSRIERRCGQLLAVKRTEP